MSMEPSSYVMLGIRLDPYNFDNAFYEKLEEIEDNNEYQVIYSESEGLYYVGFLIGETDPNNYMFNKPVFISDWSEYFYEIEKDLFEIFDLKHGMTRFDFMIFSTMG